MKKLTLKHFLITLAIWTVIGVLGTTKSAVMSTYRGQNSDWLQISYFFLSAAWVWVLLTPLLFKLTRVVKFQKGKISKQILLYIGIGILVAPLHRSLAIWLDFTVRNLQGTLDIPVSQMLDQVKLVILSTSIDSFLTYWVIIGVFLGIDYYNGYKEKQVNNAKLEAELSKSQLNNLKAQLHPHFLFNSIQAISTLMHRDIELADSALTRLSFLLRKSFENINTQKITLKEEMEFLNHYIQLQKLRFQEKVDISINIQEETLDHLVPTLILQPLVENAFKHGIEASREKGTISIYSEMEKESIILKISNSVSKSNNQFKNGNGVGLNNTRKRLEHLYGENSYLEIEDSKRGEFKITIEIPAEKITFFK